MQTLNQQKELVKYISDGFTSLQIAPKFGVSHKTIEKNISDLKKEYGASNSVQLACIFLRKKLIK